MKANRMEVRERVETRERIKTVMMMIHVSE